MTNKQFNPNIITYIEQPTPEAIKAASMVSKFTYWMANQATKEAFINAFGKVMGEHFWNKRTSIATRTDSLMEADLYSWYEMSDNNRAKLMHYILRTGYKA